MGSSYTIFGKVFQPYHITLATLGSLGAVVSWSVARREKPTAPKIEASSSEEEKFINDFIKKAESEAAPAKH